MNIAVIGLGLIGGSAVRALSAAGHRVLGYDADPATRATARTAAATAPAGARWQVSPSVADAVEDAELVLIAVPLPAMGDVFDEIAATGRTPLVTDVASVKAPVVTLARSGLHRFGHALAGFVGGHPMAGRETSGFVAADPALFEGCAWVLCLEEDTGLDDWLTVAALVTEFGARPVPTTAVEHDRAVAAVSHVPHLIAAALAASASNDPLATTLAAGSFRDGTRVAASRPELIAAMCGANAAAVTAALDVVLAELTGARAALDSSDPTAALAPWLAAGCAVRRAWPPSPGQTATLPARPDVLRRLGAAGGWLTAVAADRRTVTAVLPSTVSAQLGDLDRSS